MMNVDDALTTISNQTPKWEKRKLVPARKSVGRILAEEVTAQRDIPQFDNSAMDGFVLRKKDWDEGQRSFPVAFEIRPEYKEPSPVPEGQCARIMTGAPIPENGDQVIPIELAQEENEDVTFSKLPGRNPIRLQGEGYEKGKIVLEKGTLIRPYEMGLIIESGNRSCTILEALKVALQVTGSEVDETMNTNGPVLKQTINTWPGVEVKEWPVLEDEPGAVKNRLLQLKDESDVIITTGGISAGKHDYLYATLQELGAEVLIRKVNQKPGKPFTFLLWDDTPVCNLPGNPVSAVFCAEMYARRVIAHMLSIPAKEYEGILLGKMENHRSKTLFVPGFLKAEDGNMAVSTDSGMRSHLMQLYEGNNGYVRVEPKSHYAPGDKITVIPFSNGSFPWL